MAKERWLMLLLVGLMVAIAVPITIFALSTEIGVKVDAEDSAGNKLKVDAKSLGETTLVGCKEMKGVLEFESGPGVTGAAVKLKIEPQLWSDVSGSAIDIYDEFPCGSFEVRIDLLADPITVTTGASGSSLPSNTFTLGVDPKTVVEVGAK